MVTLISRLLINEETHRWDRSLDWKLMGASKTTETEVTGWDADLLLVKQPCIPGLGVSS